MSPSLPKVRGILLLAALPLTWPSSASAAAGSEFGHHVQSCAQDVGFHGTHNPGMHTGFAGWDPTHVC